ncbi:MAG TPA: SH3 domain-containing protein [Thermoanaerobaculia bacterium]|nr:SH3 domain-containing protein [Thermoanaerobaculia bacterium]
MKVLSISVAALTILACRPEAPPASATAATRAPIETRYVRDSEATVRLRPGDDAPVVMKYQNGESVTLLAKKGDWAEVRTFNGTGWAKLSELATAEEATALQPDNATPRFKKAPAPITQTTVHGEIVLEASVNNAGEVVAVRILTNTTGSQTLVQQNIVELRAAKFFPIVQHGKRIPFVYEYRVHY